ncbi:KilA-N domain-containing protein [Faucicola boevrei]|uniref:KilA-N domain-containing protein n=1 Tax=Faucicola boevrei TaxID=346665 RepID=UPI0003823B56|nr:KilA-N domain-containing protein [Moraxella boevrei]
MSNLIVANTSISQHNGFFSLTDLHKSSGGADKHKPSNFMRNDETKELIAELEKENTVAYHTVQGKQGGTYACRELVIRYGMWISAKFSLEVIRAFDNLNTGAIPCLPKKTNAHQRQALVTACDKLAVGNTLRSDIYKMVGNQFGVDDIQSIPMHQLADATAFVYEIILAKQQTPKNLELPQKTIERLASQFAKTAILINHVKNEYLPFLYTANFAKAEKVSVHLALINYDIQDNCQDLFKLLPSEIKNDNAHPIVSELQTAYYHDNLLKCPQKIA